MAKSPILSDVTSILTSGTILNGNWDLIEAAFLNTLSRDGSTPNQMEADFDLNSNDVLNGGSIYTDKLYIDGVLVSPTGLVGSNALLIDNNLSDLGDIPTALTNLGITANTDEINYLSGAVSNIQTQINNVLTGYLPLTGGNMTGDIIQKTGTSTVYESLDGTKTGDISISNEGTVDFLSSGGAGFTFDGDPYTIAFKSRAELVAYVAVPNVPKEGLTYAFEGQLLRGSVGATVISDLPGLLPIDNVANADHLGLTVGTATDGEATVNSTKINAWLALADGNVFDFRMDDISIGATIALARHGNGIIGKPATWVFGGATDPGAICRWRGASGGIMVKSQYPDTTNDVYSTVCRGVTLDGRSLAQVGYSWVGCQKPIADDLHVTSLLDDVSSYAYQLSGIDNDVIGCVYGGKFGSLTCIVTGDANGFVTTGPVSVAGSNVSFCQFEYIHVTCVDGFSFVFQDMDDCSFTQIAVSRGAGGTGGTMLLNSSISNGHHITGNTILNCNMGVTDGSNLKIQVSDAATLGNYIRYNGVDFTTDLVFTGGSKRSDNKFVYLGRTDFVGGFADMPTENLLPLANVVVNDARILDYYLEGTATPTITIGGSSTGITYAAQALHFTRIGNRVHITGDITLSSKGAGSGDVVLEGLPFTAHATAPSAGISIGYYAGLAAVGDAPLGAVVKNTTTCTLFKQGAAAAVALQASDITNAFRLIFTATYHCAE